MAAPQGSAATSRRPGSSGRGPDSTPITGEVRRASPRYSTRSQLSYISSSVRPHLQTTLRTHYITAEQMDAQSVALTLFGIRADVMAAVDRGIRDRAHPPALGLLTAVKWPCISSAAVKRSAL
uniref:Uncharacterized protein n=1 Tax=Knipowitschia caucasica TaxID=637954 RepID=A0AAV2KYQ7_KNICA